MKAYEWMKKHTNWQEKTVGGVWLILHVMRWMLIGCVLGLVFCLETGSSDYQNAIGGAGALFAMLPGAVLGMALLLGGEGKRA